ncbi:hypothetical protein LEMLEM_LOCUS16443 [Lemmus lemmus]
MLAGPEPFGRSPSVTGEIRGCGGGRDIQRLGPYDCGFFPPGPKLTAPLLAAAVQAVLSLGSRAKISSDSCAPILSCQRLVWREASRGMGCPQEL